LGKRKVLTESHLKELRMPETDYGEMLGRVIKLLGGDHVLVNCTDNITRLCRIRGKMKRKMWIRANDVVLLAPWDFNDKKADILWRYIRAHADWLVENKHITPLA